jgi:hypothetical protein
MQSIFLNCKEPMNYTFVPQWAQNSAFLFNKASPQNEQNLSCCVLLSST